VDTTDQQSTDQHSKEETRHFVDRRRGRDWMTKATSVFTGLGWLFAMFMMLLFSKAHPEEENFITRVLNIALNTNWNSHFLWLSLYSLIAAFIFCLMGILFTIMRSRRKSDRFNKPLIFLSVMSAVGIFMFLSLFHRYM
jgi:preprotein translocase subunit SecG